jgi:hypothetical protein
MTDTAANPQAVPGSPRYHVIVNPMRINATAEIQPPCTYETRAAAENERDRRNAEAGDRAYLVIATSR